MFQTTNQFLLYAIRFLPLSFFIYIYMHVSEYMHHLLQQHCKGSSRAPHVVTKAMHKSDKS